MYRMTPARKAALKKAQLASARKRKSRGKAPVRKNRVRAVAAASKGVRRRGAAPKSSSSKASVKSRNRKIAKRTAIAVGAIGAAAGAGYVYKNRENLIVQPMAQRRFVKIAERKRGRKLTRREKIAVKSREKRLHKRRSIDAVRAYRLGREMAQMAYRNGKSLNPRSKNYIFANIKMDLGDDGVKRNGKYGVDHGRFMFELYRKDVNARAERRFNRMKGKKAGFSYRSGKQKRVSEKGKVTRLWW